MSKHTAARLPWASVVLFLVIAVTTLVVQTANDSAWLWVDIFNSVVLGVFVMVGSLIASRRPANLIGWLFILQGILSQIGWLGIEYGVYGLITLPGSVPYPEWAGLVGIALRSISFVLTLAPLLLIFPEGQLLSHRWRIVVWLFLVGTALNVADVLFEPKSYETRLLPVPQSIGVQVPTTVVDLVSGTMYVIMMITVAAAVAAVIIRSRRARGDERQQLKWFAYVAFLALVFVIIFAALSIASPRTQFSIPHNLGSLIFSFAIMGFPISAGIAILKYRLYDIDLIIRRTLVYALLTAILALAYFGSVVLLGELARTMTGQQQSDIVIVLSTLANAALFAPLRRRIQELIDRRLYRSKYNAAQVLTTFGMTVRDEVDLGKLKEELLDVVEDTMQPAHVSLWVNQPGSRPKR